MNRLRKPLMFFCLVMTLFTALALVACRREHKHNLTAHTAKEATCQEEGVSAYWECTDCGRLFADGAGTREINESMTVIPKSGHSANTWVIDKEATCSEEGMRHKVCTVCTTVFDEERTEKTPHILSTLAGLNSTCLEKGFSDGKKCIVCNEIVVPQTELPFGDHTYGNWIVDEEPSCSKEGTRHRTCLVCKKAESVAIEKIPHTLERVEGYSATCLEEGLSDGITCSVCNAVVQEQEIIYALGHEPDTWIITKNATCTEQGERYRVCTQCGEEIDREAVPEVPHTHEVLIKVDPTCTATGLTEGLKCSVCDEVFTPQEVIAKLEHTFGGRESCSVCSYHVPSEGLAYALAPDGESAYVAGIGTCTEKTIYLADEYEDVPVIALAAGAFKNSELLRVTLSYSIEVIGEGAFEGCARLMSITLSSNLEEIEEDAFKGCSRLIEVCNYSSLPLSCESTEYGGIAYYAKNILTPESGESNFITTAEGILFYSSEESGNVLLDVSSILASNRINLPESLRGGSYTVASYAFSECSSVLIRLNIPAGVLGIEAGAFTDCFRLRQITVAQDNAMLQSKNNVLYNKAGTVLLQYPLGETATQFVVPDGVTEIADYAFGGCVNLESITLPDGITRIGNHTFEGCSALKSLPVKSGLTEIGSYAFGGCERLAALSFPNTLVRIGDYAFSGCKLLKQVTVQEGLESIGAYAFYNCNVLAQFTLPSSVRSVALDAFKSCQLLQRVDITNFVAWCNINFEEAEGYDHANPLCYGGVLYLNGAVLTGSFTVPSVIKKLPARTFQKSTVTDVTIPGSVESLGSYAFSDCALLTSVCLNNGLKSIGERAFLNCKKLTAITLPDSVVTLGNYAFSGCSTLTNVVLPAELSKISSGMFFSCESLLTLNIPSTVTAIGDRAFQNCMMLRNFTIPAGVTAIEDGTFYDCDNLLTVLLPEGIVRIGDGAFSSCNSLRNVLIPGSVQSIGDYAFDTCNQLNKIYYSGTYEDWEALELESTLANGKLTAAKLYFYSEEQPAEAGNYWHYNENGAVTEW